MTPSPDILVELPAILGEAVGMRRLTINGATVRDAVAALRRHAKLGPLIFEESGTLRRHVILFVNDTAIQHLNSLDTRLTPDDRIAVVQPVSGG